MQFGADLELFFRTLIGTGSNPNVAAVVVIVVIGIEPAWTQIVVAGIEKSGKPVAGFAIEQNGDLKTIAQAARCAKDFLQVASEQPRLPAATPEVGEKFLKLFHAYQQEVILAHKTSDLSDSQPTKGNIAGGLTTIEEKALGNLEKLGHQSRYIDALAAAETPSRGPGLYFMDTSSAAAECITLMAAGFVVHTFPTGQGNIVGHPIVPVIKITGNPRTLRTMSEHIDVDVTGVLTRAMTIKQAGEAVIGMIARTALGRITAAEALGHREFVLTKLYRSA